MNRYIKTSICLLGVLFAGLTNLGQVSEQSPNREDHPKRAAGPKPPKNINTPMANLPEIASKLKLSIALGRPTDQSVTMNLFSVETLEGYIAYGLKPGHYLPQTVPFNLVSGKPHEVVVNSLQPDTLYYYRLRYRKSGSNYYDEGKEYAFHTQRVPGSSFSFTVTADPHLDNHTDLALYQRTLASALNDKPDFHIDLGDTFMTEKYADQRMASYQYLAQRYCYDQMSHSVPLFLVLGNHDGEKPGGRGRNSTALAVFANTMRKQYFTNPIPDRFYTGNQAKHPTLGLLQDYYAWEWGNALFIALDPYWFEQQQQNGNDNWKHTLGLEQYLWLKQTLESSRATFKCVFIHQLVGGKDEQGRGGVEAAPFYEWGGKNADGSDGFNENRSDWPMPIHQLFQKNHVSIVFHGHDHLFATQELDGIIYQEVPQPGNPNTGHSARFASEYGYQDGVILGGSGYLRITVFSDKLKVDYISINTLPDESMEQGKQQILHTYTIQKKQGASGR